MNENSLKVYINKSLCGTLSLEDDKYIFNYRDDASSVVSLTMPIRQESWNTKKLHPIFEMNMPEGALREAIKNHFAKLQTMDDINFLKLIGPYMLGRIKFNELKNEKDALVLDDILSSDKTDLFEELMQKFAIRSGVSGVQPKLLLTAQNKTTMAFDHFIVKSWESSYPQLALNEYFCMRAIKNASLPTPEFYISDDLSMFVMKRFDVITTTIYIKNDIPALKLSDAKIWWKEKTLKKFATASCGLSNREYENIMISCQKCVGWQ